ncbi:MAG: DUF6186 family protein [Micrococcales bacterium]
MNTYWITTGGYLTLLFAALVLWFTTRGSQGKFASLAEVFRRVMHYRGTRVGLILAWWWLGYHFLVNVVQR